jgi:hypothetical protein
LLGPLGIQFVHPRLGLSLLLQPFIDPSGSPLGFRDRDVPNLFGPAPQHRSGQGAPPLVPLCLDETFLLPEFLPYRVGAWMFFTELKGETFNMRKKAFDVSCELANADLDVVISSGGSFANGHFDQVNIVIALGVRIERVG